MSYSIVASDGFTGDGAGEGRTLDNGGGGSNVNTWTKKAGDGGWSTSVGEMHNDDASGHAPNYLIVDSETAVADQRVTVGLTGLADVGLIARWSVSTWYNLYWFNGGGGALYLYNSTDLVFDTALLSTASPGDVLMLECTGDVVTVSVNGSVRHSATVSSGPPTDLRVASGKPGLYAGSGFINKGFDNFLFETAASTATKLGVTTQPGGNASGTAFTTQPVVAVQDAGSSTVTSDTSTVVATLNTISGTGTLSGTTSKAAVAGVATFTNLVVTGAGSFTITFTDGSLTPITTATFYVGATQLAFTTTPSVVYSRKAHSNLVVTIQDAGGNTMAGLTSSVTVAANRTSSGTSIFQRNGSAGTVTKSAVAGVATFDDLQINCTSNDVLTTTGTYTATCGALTATSSGIPGLVRGWTDFTGA